MIVHWGRFWLLQHEDLALWDLVGDSMTSVQYGIYACFDLVYDWGHHLKLSTMIRKTFTENFGHFPLFERVFE